ncbi:MAG: hypothetical protein ABIQ04_00840 [Candidatus Saccharimonadales bacterium]
MTTVNANRQHSSGGNMYSKTEVHVRPITAVGNFPIANRIVNRYLMVAANFILAMLLGWVMFVGVGLWLVLYLVSLPLHVVFRVCGRQGFLRIGGSLMYTLNSPKVAFSKK